jgi:ribosome maturation factor RimP
LASIDAIARLLEPAASAAGFELVRVKFVGGKTLQVMAERPDGTMNVDDCAELSRAFSEVLDAADPIAGEYVLEVSSPGIDRPLTRPKDYARFLGHEARIEFSYPVEGKRRTRAILKNLAGETLTLALEGTEPRDLDVPLSAIAEAKLVLTGKLIAETQTQGGETAPEPRKKKRS